MWNAKNGTPFNKDQPFVMAHHKLHVPKMRKAAKGPSALLLVAKAMNDPTQRAEWD